MSNLDLQKLINSEIEYYLELRVEAAKQQDWVTNSNYAGVIHGLDKAKRIIDDYFTTFQE
jgi:hypothetical protein